MGNRHNKQGCCINHHHLHKYEEQRNLSRSCSRSMLPILCSTSSSSSINDIVLPIPIPIPIPSIITNLEEPLSPKVGCMGQVKKRSNRVSATPPHNHLHKNNNPNPVSLNYSNLRKNLFSTQNLLPSSTTSINTTTRLGVVGGVGIRCNSWLGPRTTTTTNSTSQQHHHQLSFIREMDPPLPVVLLTNNNKPQHQDSSILWKRRFGHVSSLKTLDLNTTPL